MEIFCGQEKIRRPFNDRSNTLISPMARRYDDKFWQSNNCEPAHGRASLLHVMIMNRTKAAPFNLTDHSLTVSEVHE